MFILFLLKTGKILQKHNGNMKLVFFTWTFKKKQAWYPPPTLFPMVVLTTFTGSDSSDSDWILKCKGKRKHLQYNKIKHYVAESDGQKAERWRLNHFIPGEARTGDLLEALAEEDRALDESVRVSQARPLCFDCVLPSWFSAIER